MAALEESSSSDNFDDESRNKANGIFGKIATFYCVSYLMFLKNVMWKTKIMVYALQEESLAVTTTESMMGDTLQELEHTWRYENCQNRVIDAAVSYAKRLVIDAEADFLRVHRRGRAA